MKTVELMSVELPPQEISLDERITTLKRLGVQFSIYAKNFLAPPFLTVQQTGSAHLRLASFWFPKSARKATAILNSRQDVIAGKIEHFFQMLACRELFQYAGSIIVCPDAVFSSPADGRLYITTYVQVGSSYADHNVGLISQEKINRRALFLSVSR